MYPKSLMYRSLAALALTLSSAACTSAPEIAPPAVACHPTLCFAIPGDPSAPATDRRELRAEDEVESPAAREVQAGARRRVAAIQAR